MDFNFDTGTIFDGIQVIDTTVAPPLGTFSNVLSVVGNGAIIVTDGSTAQRPASPVQAMFRFNNSFNQLEYYDGTTWLQLTSSAGAVTSFQTSLSGLTPNTPTTGAITLAGVLGVASGGTGDTSLTTNGVLYGQGTSPVAVTAAGVQDNVLTVNGSGVPLFGSVNLAASAAVGSSILALANGGTNAALTGSNGSIIYNTGTALANSTVGSVGQVLQSTGAGAPTWHTASSTITTNQIVEGDGTGAFTANGATFVGSGSFSGITLNGTVTNATDATTKFYVDSLTAGLSWKQAVQARTTADLGSVIYNNGSSGVGATLTNNGTQAALVLDGYTVQTGDRVLVANQAAPAQNGIYVVTNTGSGSTNWVLTRSTDNNTSAEMDGAAVFVERGSLFADTAFVQTAVQPITIGTTAINWTQFAGSGTYTAGSGLTLTGTQFNVKTDGVTTYINGSNDVAVLSSSTIDQVLLSQGTGNTAAWGALPLNNSNAVTGVLQIANGGTGTSSTPTNGQILVGNGTGYSLTTITAGTGISVTNGTGTITIANTGVLSFSLNDNSTTSIYTTTPTSATTGAVASTITLKNQSANLVFSGPATGAAAQPTFRSLVYADLPLKLYAENPSTPTAPVASGTNSVAVGSGATASATLSYATGDGTNASVWGSKAFANGDFATAGDAQSGLYVLRNLTTDNTATQLWLDGTAATQALVFPNNSVVTFDILVSARRTDAVGGGAGWRIVGVIRKDTTTASNTFVGTPSVTILGRTNSAWTVAVTANTTTGELRVTVTGENAKTIRWVATVETSEVTN